MAFRSYLSIFYLETEISGEFRSDFMEITKVNMTDMDDKLFSASSIFGKLIVEKAERPTFVHYSSQGIPCNATT